MIKTANTHVYNIARAVYSSRNPMNSWDKSDSNIETDILGEADLALAKKLRKAGPDHRKFMRQIFVSVDISAPIYWWKEADTYGVGVVKNSTSTMHKIHAKPFSIDDFSTDHMTGPTKKFMETVLVPYLESVRRWYMEHGKNKEDWYDIIQLLPSSYNQMRTVTLNYENLVNMYHARKNHKLTEWHELCDWIKTLPYAKELIVGEED